MATRVPAQVFSPGEFIKEELEARGWTQGDFAAILGRPIQAVNELIAAKRGVTTDTARALGAAFGTGPELWMNLESAWRLSQLGEDDGEIVKRAKLYSKAPVRELIRREWIQNSDNHAELERRVLNFMGMSSLDDTPVFHAAARKSTRYSVSSPAQVAWLRYAKQLAQCVHAKAFQKKRFLSRIADIRDLAVSEADARRIPGFLSDLGIRLVVVEQLQGTKLDGAAFWINKRTPVIALSMRYDRIDYLFHTLTHELGHIAKGEEKSYCDEGMARDDEGQNADSGTDKPESERLADEFAVNLLVPQEELDFFIDRVRPHYSRKKIVEFANRIGIHPGIVIGQLQHRNEIGYWHSRPLLSKVRREFTDAAMTDGWGHRPELYSTE